MDFFGATLRRVRPLLLWLFIIPLLPTVSQDEWWVTGVSTDNAQIHSLGMTDGFRLSPSFLLAFEKPERAKSTESVAREVTPNRSEAPPPVDSRVLKASESKPELFGMTVGEFAIAAATFLLVLVTVPIAFESIRRIWIERGASVLLIRSVDVRLFNPAWIVTAYGVGGYLDYWPTAVEDTVDEAFRNRENVLLIGRPHVGKSRTAIQNIQKHFGGSLPWNRWRVIQPLPDALDALSTLRIPKRRYVLLLDDLDVYLKRDESQGAGVLQLVQSLQRQAKQLMIVATVRRTLPEFAALSESTSILGRWREVEIPDWSYDAGLRLANQLGTDFTSWDGTPLSVIRPSSLMAERYRTGSPEEKKTLRMLKLCFENGLYFVPRELLFSLCKTAASGLPGSGDVDDRVIATLFEKGWLLEAATRVQSFPALVPIISDWEVKDEFRNALKEVLVNGAWHQQLAGFGASRVRVGDLAGAREAYQAAIGLEPSRESYHYRLGVVYSLLRDWPSAVRCFENATHIKPVWAAAWFRLARALTETGNEQRGRQAFKKAIALGSSNPRIRVARGEVLRLEGRLDEASSELREAVRLDANDGEAWFVLARTLKARRDWVAAQEAYEKSIALRPAVAEGYFGLAEPLSRQGKFDAAKEAYLKAIELKPTMADAYTCLTSLLERDGQHGDAEKLLEEGLKMCPSSPRIYSFLGERMFRRNHSAADAERLFEKALELRPSYIEASVGLAGAQRKLAQKNPAYLEKAKATNRLVIERDPDNENAYLGLGLCLLQEGKWDEAAAAFNRVVELKPAMAAGWFYRGQAFRRAGYDTDQVLSHIRHAQQLGFSPERCGLESARSLADGGRASEALALLLDLARRHDGRLPPHICRDPSFSSLRSEAAFKQVCRGNS